MTQVPSHNFELYRWLDFAYHSTVVRNKIRKVALRYRQETEDVLQEVCAYLVENEKKFLSKTSLKELACDLAEYAPSDGYIINSLENIARKVCNKFAEDQAVQNYDNYTYSRGWISDNLLDLISSLSTSAINSEEAFAIHMDFQQGWLTLSDAEQEALIKTAHKMRDNSIIFTTEERSAKRRALTKVCREMNNQASVKWVYR